MDRQWTLVSGSAVRIQSENPANRSWSETQITVSVGWYFTALSEDWPILVRRSLFIGNFSIVLLLVFFVRLLNWCCGCFLEHTNNIHVTKNNNCKRNNICKHKSYDKILKILFEEFGNQFLYLLIFFSFATCTFVQSFIHQWQGNVSFIILEEISTKIFRLSEFGNFFVRRVILTR